MNKGLLTLSIIAFLLVSSVPCIAQTFDKNIREAQESYEKGDFERAGRHYTEAQVDKPDSVKLKFNRGNALYKSNQFEEALKSYEQALKSEKEPVDKSKIHYNLANTYYKAGKTDEALKHYLEAIRQNPANDAAIRNYEIVLNKQQQQKNQDKKQQQQQKQNQQQQKNDQNKQNQQKQNPKDNDEKEKQNNQPQKDKSQKEQSSKPQQKQPQNYTKDGMDKSLAEMILSNLKEKPPQQRRDTSKDLYFSDKDW